MAIFNTKSIAFKWYFFTRACPAVCAEFSHLFMKQLGLTSNQIGVASFFGVHMIFVPLLFLVADRYRVRKLITWILAPLSAISYLLLVLPIFVSLPTCFATSLRFNGSGINSSEVVSAKYQSVPWLSSLFLVLTLSRTSSPFLACASYSLSNLATLTFLGGEQEKFGRYLMWQHVGTGTLIFGSALFAWTVRMDICGNRGYGYFGSFLIAAFFVLTSMLTLPMFEFKYESDRVINWNEVKSTVFKSHYILMFMMTFFVGAAASFQNYWEFWYLDELEGGPLVLGAAALIRRSLLAIFLFVSPRVMKKLGDLNTFCIAVLFYTVAFFFLAFTRVYWFVLAVDFLQSAGYALSCCSLAVHFFKAGSKAISGTIMGLQKTFFFLGTQGGATLFGILFYAMGTRATLFASAAFFGMLFAILLLYLRFSEHVHEYEKLPTDEKHNTDTIASGGDFDK